MGDGCCLSLLPVQVVPMALVVVLRMVEEEEEEEGLEQQTKFSSRRFSWDSRYILMRMRQTMDGGAFGLNSGG